MPQGALVFCISEDAPAKRKPVSLPVYASLALARVWQLTQLNSPNYTGVYWIAFGGVALDADMAISRSFYGTGEVWAYVIGYL